MEWTDRQLEAIGSRGSDILVAAAAGSGKTAVLTERIKTLVVDERVDIGKLLVVTFTEAAAGEMKQRITASLEEAGAQIGVGTPGADAANFISDQLRRTGAAAISTFHSFALSIIKEHCYEIGLAPPEGICDEQQSFFMKEKALDSLLAEKFDEGDEVFIAFLNNYSAPNSERNIREMILEVYERIMSYPSPFAWLDEAVEKLALGLDDEMFIGVLGGEIAYKLKSAERLMAVAAEILSDAGCPSVSAQMRSEAESVAEVRAAVEAGRRTEAGEKLSDISFERISCGKGEKEAYETVKDRVKAWRDRAKKIVHSTPSSPSELKKKFFFRTAEQYDAEVKETVPYVRALCSLVKRFDEIYSQDKRDEGLIDFNDFEHMALSILENESVADEYRKRFEYIFVDEYQDSNHVQETLISRISRGDNVFMVGDVKQSIYRFRNAEPKLFLEKYGRYKAEAGAGGSGLLVDLNANFRSGRGILGSVNSVFAHLIEEHYSGMAYDDGARLVPGSDAYTEQNDSTELILVPSGADRTVSEAKEAARIIDGLIGTPWNDAKTGSNRLLRYRDIVILLRAAKNRAEKMKQTLESEGIPAYVEEGKGYFDTIEIEAFIALLKAIDNMRQDVPLAAALISPVFGFSPEDMARIRIACPDGEYFRAFLACADAGADASLSERCGKAALRLREWKEKEQFAPTADFMWEVVSGSGLYDYYGTIPGGRRRQANLMLLIDIASGYAAGRVSSLSDFLGYVDVMKKNRRKVDLPQAQIIEDDSDVVRIMTIHKSKGLEFPVVIQCGLNDRLTHGSQGSGRNMVSVDKELGIALEWRDASRHIRKKSLYKNMLDDRRAAEERAESIRLLYVAMTRAKNRLFLIGSDKNPEGLLEKYDGAEPEVDTDIMGASTWLRMILPAVMNDQANFKVTVSGESAAIEKNQIANGAQFTIKEDSQNINVFDAATTGSGNEAGLAWIDEKFSFVYPHSAAVDIRSKYSVTQLVHEANRDGRKGDSQEATEMGTRHRVIPYTDESRAESDEYAGLSAAEKGTAMHLALELLDFAEAFGHRGNEEYFMLFLKKLSENGVLQGREEAVTVESLMKFASSQICGRAASAKFILKELPFNMKMEHESGEEIVVQGVIDCLLGGSDGLYLYDYKTGHFRSGDAREAERIIGAYGMQLELYAKAAEMIYGEAPQEASIYMTRTGDVIRVNF